jgi:hypothetical protein
MYFNDIYILKASNPFDIMEYEEVTVNLELEKVPPCYHTVLKGTVLYKDLPIKNATVKVFDKNYNPLYHAATDMNGNYVFDNILAPGEYKVIATAEGYNTSITKNIKIKMNSINKLSFSLKQSSVFVNGIVYGKVLEAVSQKPIDNALVYLKSLENDCETVYKTTSNSSGQYLIYNIIPNRYKLIMQKQGYFESIPIELIIENNERIIMNVDLIKNSKCYKSTLNGTITFDKKPISDVAVFLYLIDNSGAEEVVQIQQTNKYGHFLFSNVESGSYIIKGTLQNGVLFEKHFKMGKCE